MTDAVKGVGLQSAASQIVEEKQADHQYRRRSRDLSDAISQGLLKNKQNRANFRTAKQAELKSEIASFTNRDAKKTAKNILNNEVAAARVDSRAVYIDESKYNAAKSADMGHEHKLIKDKKILNVIAENPEDFIGENGFSSDYYKHRTGRYLGFDNKGNLDEKKAMSLDYGISAKKAGKMMKTAGYDVEKDLTWLYRSLAALGVLGTTAAVGGLVGVPFTSNVLAVDANNQPITDPNMLKKFEELLGNKITYDKDGFPIVDTIKSVGGNGIPGALKGMIGGLIPSLALAAFVKDNGGKDIFNGLSAEAIVAKGDRNINKKISGKTNQKIMREILKMENLSNEDKAFILQLAYGELTAKKVNDRELAAAYEICKYLNKHPELNPKDYDKLPGKKDEVDDKGDDKPEFTGRPDPVVVEEDDNDHKPDKKDPCEISLVKDGTIKDKKEITSHEYTPKKGEYWASIVAAKYGVSGKEGMDVVHELKRLHGITDFTKNIQPKTMQLPEVITIGDKEYKLDKDKDVTVKTDKFAPADKYNGKFTNPFKFVEVPTYAVKGCENETLASGVPEKTAYQKAQEIAKANPNKYIFNLPE